MAFTLPPLPFAMNALEPYMSEKTLSYHYGKHHRGYVDTLNTLIAGTDYESMPLEEIIRTTQQGPIFNNASQNWNHTFFWNSLTPNGGGAPSGRALAAIEAKWENYDAFKEQFIKSAAGNFGSGWTWLIQTENGTLDILNTSNAGSPISSPSKPLMVCDVWEHAYYLDYYNVRAQFVTTFLEHLVNWEFVEKNLQ